MKAIYSLFPGPESAQRAVDLLRSAPGLKIDERNIAVVSSEPFDEFEFGRRDAETPMPWLAALGGLIGGTCGFFLAALTQKAYPLVTGGMPIVSLWPNGIITYEMTMLGAIIATLLTLLVSARLPDWKKNLYDPEIAEGKILVGVTNPPEGSRVELEGKLREAGASQVKEFISP